MQELCSNCSATAQYSIKVLVSSVGIRPREQESSPAVRFCAECLHELCERLCSDELRKAVNTVLTKLNERLRERTRAANDSQRAI